VLSALGAEDDDLGAPTRSGGGSSSGSTGRATRDIPRGIDSGRFQIDDTAVTVNATGGALVGTTRGVLEGRFGEGADVLDAELVLRMLGVPPDDAAEVARRPL
jgi:Tetracyclin repressor-like, C-terminal domain